MRKNNKFKTSGTKWNVGFELPDGSYCILEYITKKPQTLTGKPPVEIYVNRIHNRFIFKIEVYYYLELLTLETMKLLGSTEKNNNKQTKDKNGENVTSIENFGMILVHCNVVSNKYKGGSSVLSIFVQIKSFGQLSNISLTNRISKDPFGSEFS